MKRKILAVASGGGHWEQMMLLRDVMGRFDVRYVTTDADLAARDGFGDAVTMTDCNRNDLRSTAKCCLQAFRLVRAFRPDVVISTGALPGLACILAGRLFGARTLWIDSVANSERLSGSGRIARFIASSCLTQWEHLSSSDPRVSFSGSLL